MCRYFFFYCCLFRSVICSNWSHILITIWTQKELKIQCLHVPKTKLDLSSDLDLSTAWVQPICLAFLKMYCTVCHSSRCGLTSPTVKATGSRPGLPAERQGWKLCRDGCRVSTPHPQGLPAQAPGQTTPSSSLYLYSPTHTTSYSKSLSTDLNCISLHAVVV